MLSRINSTNPNQNQSYSKKTSYNPQHLAKDFKGKVTAHDFIGSRDIESKHIGYFDNIQTVLYKENKNVYYIQAIDKEKIIDIKNLQKYLNINYNNDNFDDYILNLETQYEENGKLFLVFEGIKRYTSLEKFLKKHANNINEDNLIVIFRHILESANFLHHNNIFGCQLFLNSYIYDILTQTIKLTDTGFSKIFDLSDDCYDNTLENGFKFNEYTPPEILTNASNCYSKEELEKIQNSFYDIWQLGILFYKIATIGQSPYNDAKNETLRERIINKKINYTKLNKYNSQIVQIIDKMLQTVPENRYTIKQLLSTMKLKDNNKIPLLNIQISNNEEPVISMNMINNEKERIKNDYKIEKELNNKDIFDGIKIQGNLVTDKNGLINQEIYPDGSVLPSFKNKFLNKLNNVEQGLILDLANKLNKLDKEYLKLNENKLAVHNITSYVNNNLLELNKMEEENTNYLINKFNDLNLAKIEANELYEEMLKEKGEFAQDKYKALVSNLIYEIKKLRIDLDQERLTNDKLKKKLAEQEKKNIDLKNEHQEIIEFYQNKIDILEDVIFSSENSDNKSSKENDFKTKNKLICDALANSIENFTEINKKLRNSLEDNLAKFKENKKSWLEQVIKAKKDFRDEMKLYLEKSVSEPKIINFNKKENEELSIVNKKNEIIEKLKKEIAELKRVNKEQNNTIVNNTNYIQDINKDNKEKDEKIEQLEKKINEMLNGETKKNNSN